jgi:hypothetical protein
VIIYIVSIQNELQVKDTTDTQKSASYLDLHLEINNAGRLKIKLDDKRDDFTFPIVNFPFISSNIPASLVHGVYISQLIHYSGTCAQYSDFVDRAQLLTQTRLRCSHRYKNSTVVTTIWLTATKYPYLK